MPIRGRPSPTVTWTKDEKPCDKERIHIESNKFNTTLMISEASRDDLGKYTLTLENDSGSVSATCALKVLDTPGSCQNLEVQFYLI